MISAVNEWLSRGSVLPQRGSICKVPTEVLDMIFQAILNDPSNSSTTNLLSCICLAIACKGLLAIGKRHILEGLIAHHPRAMDCRLVCLGEYTDATDQAPPGMLTAEELQEIATTKVLYEDDKWAIAERNEDGADPDLILERCLYNFAMEHYASARLGWRKRCESLEMKRYRLWDKQGGPWAAKEKQDLHDYRMIEQFTSWVAYPVGPNVLLNLVKGEYVRETALVVFKKDPNHATLAHALLSRICYSQDASIADEFCGDEFVGRFGRGPWAGDRFCIRNEDDMPVPEEGCGFTEWTDATEEVNRLLGNLWREMGCDRDD